MDASEITAVVLTRDEERNLPRAITSLPHGCEILVLDAGSTDRTVEFARGAGARVIERAWTDFVDARRFALAQVTTPWTLVLDADEALDDRLRDAISALDPDRGGYIVRRTTYYRGKPMRMWSGEPLLRLVRTGSARVEARPASGGDAALHERLVGDGETGELPGTLLHFSYPDATAYRSKFARYTGIEARGRAFSFARALAATLLVPARFASNLVRRGALLDGPRGWTVAWYSALYPAVVAWKCRS
ncbi:MAG: glycosyltransferase family 2 protein [bacterium]|nr:glycosyltransferase family 2 protein [bacterium]